MGKFYFLQVNYIIVLRKFDFKYVDYIIQLGKFELQVDYTEDYIIELEKFREINITNIGIMNGRIETITCESDSCVRFTSFKQQAKLFIKMPKSFTSRCRRFISVLSTVK